MGLFDNLASAAAAAARSLQAVNEATRQVAVPVPESLINAWLSKLGKNDLEGLDELSAVAVVIDDGFFEVNADLTHNGIQANVRMELEVVKFRADFTPQGSGELVLRQRQAAEIKGKGWWDRLTLLVARATLSAIAEASLESWALGKVKGISSAGQEYTFDLDTLGLRSKLLEGIMDRLGSENPLIRKALEIAVGAYSLTGAACRDGSLVLELSRGESGQGEPPT